MAPQRPWLLRRHHHARSFWFADRPLKQQRLIGPKSILSGTMSSLGDVQENAPEPLSARCPISATKHATISGRKRILRSDVGRFSSGVYLRLLFLATYFQHVWIQQFNNKQTKICLPIKKCIVRCYYSTCRFVFLEGFPVIAIDFALCLVCHSFFYFPTVPAALSHWDSFRFFVHCAPHVTHSLVPILDNSERQIERIEWFRKRQQVWHLRQHAQKYERQSKHHSWQMEGRDEESKGKTDFTLFGNNCLINMVAGATTECSIPQGISKD